MDPVQEELFRDLARRLASGHAAEQIARDMDYPQSFLEQLLVREDFLGFFESEQPTAFQKWRTVREEEEVEMEVQHYLRTKASHNAKKMQDLADSGDLRPSEELSARRDLLKMSNTLRDEAPAEVVKISKQHLGALTTTMKEMDELDRKTH